MKVPTPQISVIIPVYNPTDDLVKTIEALKNQKYPKSQYTIILVDNNSEQLPREVVMDSEIVIIKETKQGSYAARNRGINYRSAEIYAFLDSDCIPHENWLNNGVKTIYNRDADLIGGKISFVSATASTYHLWDSIIHLNNQSLIKYKKCCATANLMLKKEVLSKIGQFPEWLSGGDTYYTKQAVNAGFNLQYSKDAIVYHQARDKSELIEKRQRIGRGIYRKHLVHDKSRFYKLMKIIKCMTGILALEFLRKIFLHNQKPLDGKSYAKLFFISWEMSLATGRGYMSSMINHTRSQSVQQHKSFLEMFMEIFLPITDKSEIG